ncbi:WxL domain-containing protein [Enterococcus sp. DIV0187]|uniref:WxL domain-containing protein n=1 Tax=Enterococcus sp. DIV0187 TaxID=2774644 RepID=UPI003F284FF6
MKKIRYLCLTIGLFLFFYANSSVSYASLYFDASSSMNIKFHAKFVYPDGTSVPPNELKLESSVSYVPHNSEQMLVYQIKPTEILRSTRAIGSIGNGEYSDNYKSKIIPLKILDEFKSMEGGRVSYHSLFAETSDCVKGIVPIQKVGTVNINTFLANNNNPSPITSGFLVNGSFVRKTVGTKRGYQYENVAQTAYEQYSDPLDVLFATTVGGTTSSVSGTVNKYYTGFQINSYIGTNSSAGNPITFKLEIPEINETFVDTSGNEIQNNGLHPSFIQNNKYYASGDSYQFGGGENGQATSLPSSYVGSNSAQYTYKGWYSGDTFHAGTTPSFDWKDINDEDKDSNAKIRIVYEEKKTQYNVTGSWVDDTPQANLLPPNYQLGSTVSGTVPVNHGDDFNGTGSATIHWNITDYSGKNWELQGWKNMTKDPATLITDNVPKVLDVTQDTNLHYIYKKIAPRLEINLTPDSTVMRKPGETIDWTLEINNTGYKANATGLDLSHVITKTGGNMTNPSNTVIEDNNGTAIAGITNAVWTDGGTLLASKGVAIKPNEKITVKFKTVATGDINDLLNLKTKVTATSDNLSAEDDTNVRIEDPDHHVVTDPANSKLSLLYVPTIFGFGYHEKNNNGANQTVTMATGAYQTKTVNEGFYVKLQDPRDNLAGNDWKLSANLDYFIDSSNILLPMQPVLSLDNYTSQVVNNPETDSESISPTSDVSLTTGTVTLTGGGGTVPLMNSQSTKNKGTWIFRIPFNDVKLHIPADVGEEGKGYTSELTWTLNDTI